MLTPAVVKVVHIIHVVDGAVGVEIGRDKLALPVGAVICVNVAMYCVLDVV